MWGRGTVGAGAHYRKRLRHQHLMDSSYCSQHKTTGSDWFFKAWAHTLRLHVKSRQLRMNSPQ